MGVACTCANTAAGASVVLSLALAVVAACDRVGIALALVKAIGVWEVRGPAFSKVWVSRSALLK